MISKINVPDIGDFEKVEIIEIIVKKGSIIKHARGEQNKPKNIKSSDSLHETCTHAPHNLMMWLNWFGCVFLIKFHTTIVKSTFYLQNNNKGYRPY